MKCPWSNSDTQKKEWIPSFLTFLYFSDPLWNKTSGGDGIPAELFQIVKDDAVKVLHSICQQIWKTPQQPGTGKGVYIPSQRKAMPKNVQTTAQFHSFHTLAKQCSNSPIQASAVHEP